MQENKKPSRVHSLARKLGTRKISLIAVVAVCAITGYFVLLFSSAATPVTTPPASPSVYLSPTLRTLGVNETFTVEIRENSGTTGVNAVQTNFTYPTDKLTWVSTNYSTSAFGVEAENTVDTVNGVVKIGRGVSLGASLTGDQLIGTITFTSKTVGGAANLNFATGTELDSATTNVDILAGTSAWGNATYTVDTVAPVTAVTAPAANAVIEYGATQTITVTATDAASDVTKVEIYVDGALKATDTASPYTYAWATSGVSEGAHTIYAKAYDTYNNTATTATTNVTVRDATAPTVSITAPTAGATLSGTVAVTANATDNTGGKGVSKVEFYVDGALKSTATVSPYSYSLDTKTLSDASHSLTAKAYDAAATPNVTTSSAVSVTVDNVDRVAPTSPTVLTTTGTSLTSIALAWGASTDNVGVTGYRLSRNGTVIYTGTALAYSDTGLAEGTAYNYSVVAFDAAGNNSTAKTLTTATVTRKTGDVTGDNKIDVSDLSYLLSKWGVGDAYADLNKDGKVTISDLSILLANWGK